MKAVAAAPRFRNRLGVGPQILIVVLILGLFGAMAIEPTRQLLQQRERIAGMAGDLRRVERSNERLETRVDRLKDPDFLEQRARSLGLIRAGETSYIVMPPGRSAGDKRRKKPDEAPPAPPEPGFFESFLQFVGIP